MATSEATKHTGSLVVIGGAALIAEPAAEPLPALAGADARKIVFVEPDIRRGERFRKRLEAADREVVVVAAALAAFEGEAELSVYNMPGLRSLKPAEKALSELFPGLRLRKRARVALSPLAEVLEQAGPLPEPLTLWIDLPGSEEDVLRLWQADGALDRVDHLVLRCCNEPLFAAAGTAAGLTKYLEGQGFSLFALDQSDADFPVMAFRANHGARLAAVQAGQAKLQEQLDQQRKLVEEWRQKALAFEEQNRRGEADLEAAQVREAKLQEQLDQQRKLVDEWLQEAQAFEEQNRGSEADLEAAQARETKLQEQLDQQRKLADEWRQKAEAFEEQNRGSEADLKAAQVRETKLQEQLDQQRKLANEWRQKALAFEEQNRRGEAALDAARRDLGLAMQVQANMRDDLRDLRSRFEVNERVRRQQDDLLRQLTPRLHEAARQLAALNLSDTSSQPPKKASATGGRKRAT